jgi:hypothetical protein
MYILPRIQKTLFAGGSVRRHKMAPPAPRIQCAEPAHGRLRQLRQYFSIKNQFLQCFFPFSEKPDGGGSGAAGGLGGLGKFPEKSDFIVFCVRVGEPHTKPIALGPVL